MHTPNILRLIQFDPAVQRVLGVDRYDPSSSTLARHVDLYRNSHPRSQPDCGCDQCSLKIDDYGLAIARPRLRATLYGDYDLQWYPSAASGLAKSRRGGHERKDTCGGQPMNSERPRGQGTIPGSRAGSLLPLPFPPNDKAAPYR